MPNTAYVQQTITINQQQKQANVKINTTDPMDITQQKKAEICAAYLANMRSSLGV